MELNKTNIFEAYKLRLVELGGANKYLAQLRLNQSFLDFYSLSFLLKYSANDLFKLLIEGKEEIPIAPFIDERNEHANIVSNLLKQIANKNELIIHETGVYNLYIGWPFVHGKLSDDTIVRTPLLFFPVELYKKNKQWVLVSNRDITPNKAFFLTLAQAENISYTQDVQDWDFTEMPNDLLLFKTALYEFLKEQNVPVNFNQDTFKDEIIRFKDYHKEDFFVNHQKGVLTLKSEVVLGIYPNANTSMMKDYDVFFEQGYRTVEDLFEVEEADFIPKEKNYLPFDIDGSQEAIINEVSTQKHVVVQGPPGTGKSQLICNIIANGIANHKKVLVVSQKRAALDVVFERLREKEIDIYAAIVHDVRNDRKFLYEKIETHIAEIEKNQQANQHLDTVILVRNYNQLCGLINKYISELESVQENLKSITKYKITLKELYLLAQKTELYDDVFYAYAAQSDLSLLNDFCDLIQVNEPLIRTFEDKDFLFYKRKSFADFYDRDKANIIHAIQQIAEFREKIDSSVIQRFGSLVSNENDVIGFIEQINEVEKQCKAFLSKEAIYQFEVLKKKNTDIDWLRNQKKQLTSIYAKQPEILLSLDEVNEQLLFIDNYLETKNKIKRWLWKYTSSEYKKTLSILASYHLPINETSLLLLKQRLKERLKLEKIKQRFIKKAWIGKFPDNINEPFVLKWISELLNALELKSYAKENVLLDNLVQLVQFDYNDLKSLFLYVSTLIDSIEQFKSRFENYLHGELIQNIFLKKVAVDKLIEVLDLNFEQLCFYDKIIKNLSVEEISLLKKSVLLYHNNLAESIKNNVYNHWISLIEQQAPIVKNVSTPYIETVGRKLRNAIAERQELAKDIIRLKLTEQMYADAAYNRLGNRVTYRELYHQVQKKKKVWPIRKLIENYHQDIFKLMPCWMASPETVSAIFPMKKFFDIVIFDEASQCYPEKAFPSVYRGKTIVVAGDKKQLPPYDLYSSKWDGGDEDDVDLQQNSFLDLASMYLPSKMLKGHYRSDSQELIAFSNHYFYQNELNVMPKNKPDEEMKKKLHYIKVDGVWENQVNLVEATKVVHIVRDKIESNSNLSIGIVTFNYKQAQLIKELLFEKAETEGWMVPSNLFVKNIENVQGDERDLIVFSLGYAPNAQKRFYKHFGLLNREGGENRLNVAITRAKSEIFLVTSILPHELEIEGLAFGVQLLRKYLEYVYLYDNEYNSQKISYIGEGDFVFDGTRFFEKVKKSEKNISNITLNSLLLYRILKQKSELLSIKTIEQFTPADLYIEKEKSKVLVITDDFNYLQKRSVSDSHAYLPMYMQENGWELKFAWSRNFWTDEVGFVNELFNLKN